MPLLPVDLEGSSLTTFELSERCADGVSCAGDRADNPTPLKHITPIVVRVLSGAALTGIRPASMRCIHGRRGVRGQTPCCVEPSVDK